MKDPYQVLGVAREASADEIKKAYRRLARERHPDSDPGNPWAEDEFKELSQAYDLLSHPDKRAAYDKGEIDGNGQRKRRRNPFEQFYRRRNKGDGTAGKGAERPGIKVAGANVTYALRLGFEDAFRGTVRRVATTNGKHFDVRVPPGTIDGQVLRLKGQGLPGLGGGEPGDAHVEVRVDPHPLFQTRGHDVHIEMAVTLQEAVLGGKVEAPTVDGPVTVTIPEGSNTGTVLRLKGKGLPRGAEGRGDQYVRLQVTLPPQPDKDLEKFVRKWAPKHAYDIRRTRETADE